MLRNFIELLPSTRCWIIRLSMGARMWSPPKKIEAWKYSNICPYAKVFARNHSVKLYSGHVDCRGVQPKSSYPPPPAASSRSYGTGSWYRSSLPSFCLFLGGPPECVCLRIPLYILFCKVLILSKLNSRRFQPVVWPFCATTFHVDLFSNVNFSHIKPFICTLLAVVWN
jgi:hypothetical protein